MLNQGFNEAWENDEKNSHHWFANVEQCPD